MIIIDNGKGFDVNAIKKNNGLYTIQSRAKHLGGSATIISEVGSGTQVTISLPLNEKGKKANKID
jgi:signal transduction histidine kinase